MQHHDRGVREDRLSYSDDHFSTDVWTTAPVSLPPAQGHYSLSGVAEPTVSTAFRLYGSGHFVAYTPITQEVISTIFPESTVAVMDRHAMAQASEGKVPDYALLSFGPSKGRDSTNLYDIRTAQLKLVKAILCDQ